MKCGAANARAGFSDSFFPPDAPAPCIISPKESVCQHLSCKKQ